MWTVMLMAAAMLLATETVAQADGLFDFPGTPRNRHHRPAPPPPAQVELGELHCDDVFRDNDLGYWVAYYLLFPADGSLALPTRPKWVEFTQTPLFAGSALTGQTQRYDTRNVIENGGTSNGFIIYTIFGLTTGPSNQVPPVKPIAGPWAMVVRDDLDRSCRATFTVPEPGDWCTRTSIQSGDPYICIAE